MQLTPTFTSVGVNRVVNTLDWASNGLIAYGGHWMVCIYDYEKAAVVGTLTGHKGQVNCVKWLPQSVCPPGVSLLLSGAADNIIRVWAWFGQQHNPPWRCITELKAHNSPVTSLAVQELNSSTFLLASTSGDPQLQLWHCNHHAGQQQQQQLETDSNGHPPADDPIQPQLEQCFGPAAWQQLLPVPTGPQIQHCVALARLPEDPDWLVMATGGTDSTVRLFVRGPSSSSSSSSERAPGHHQQQQNGVLGLQDSGFRLQCQLKGHENWIRGVAFAAVRETAADGADRVSLLLATAAQDRYGRIWCITTDASHNSSSTAEGSSSSSSSTSTSQADVLRQLITRYAPRPHLTTNSKTYWVALEALLVGHEDWLHTITWRPSTAAAEGAIQVPTRHDLMLLTTSQDRSMMLWCYDEPSGLWMSEAAVGDAGASCLGFYGGAFSPDGHRLVAHGFTGALHIWQQQGEAAAAAAAGSSGSSSSRRDMHWVPQHALGGHYGAVEDLCWGGDGACLQSVGTDQTARLFTGCQGHWFELARTQVHGHDFSCLAAIPTPLPQTSSSGSGSTSPSVLYVSGSEEKVLRVFEAPQAFFDTLTAIRSSQSPDAAAAVAAAMSAAAAARGSSVEDSSRGRALGASVSALGLSNKALYIEDQGGSGAQGLTPGGSKGVGFGQEAYNEGPDFVPCAVPSVVSDPPLEEHLAQNTLWPEIRKLYGHGNDVFCVCASPSGRIVASACKAQSAGAAAVWVWEVGSWKAIAQLPGHTLTVTQLEFSQDGRYLLSGSRDRSYSVWKVPGHYAGSAGNGSSGSGNSSATDAANNAAAGEPDSAGGFELVVRAQKAHSRIIWGVSWSHDSRFCATGSRDQTVKLWAVGSSGMPGHKAALTLPAFPAGVTAVALAPQHVSAAAAAAGVGSHSDAVAHLLAVGLEDGRVSVWAVEVTGQGLADGASQEPGFSAKQLWASEAWCQHASVVRRLRWAPAGVDWLCGGASGMCLASCGEDNSVRVFSVGS